VWRNSPLEDMHAGGGLRGLGSSDGEMFAESVALHRAAKAALPEEFGLLEFEDHVLDRHRPWAAGRRTLQEMGYGSLGAFTKHVRGRTNALLAIRDDGDRLLLRYLIMVTRLYGRPIRDATVARDRRKRPGTAPDTGAPGLARPGA
jgi:hypothetical protein